MLLAKQKLKQFLSYSCMSNITTKISNHNKTQISKSSKPPRRREKQLQTAETYILAPWTETVTKATLFIEQTSPHHNLERRTYASDFATLLSNYDTEITCALSETNDTETQLSSASTSGI